MRMLVRTLLAGVALAAAVPAAHAMTMLRQGDTAVLAGPVVPEDGAQFRRLLAEGPLKRVILLSSRGGNGEAAYSIASQMQANSIDSVVAGSCVSACAMIFMGGRERQMMGGKALATTRLGFHAPHKHTTKALSPRGADRLDGWLQQRSGGKFNGELLARVINITRPNDMLFFYYPGGPGADSLPSVVFCVEGVRVRSQCEQFPGASALDAGVLTTDVLFSPDTPIYAAAVATQPPEPSASAAPADKN